MKDHEIISNIYDNCVEKGRPWKRIASASSSRREPRPSVKEFAQNRLEGF